MSKIGSSTKIQRLLKEASLLCHSGKFNEAKEIYQALLELIPNHPEVLGNLGTIELQRGNNDLGISFLTRALKSNPTEIKFIINLANAYISINKFTEALEQLESAEKISPNLLNILYNKARALRGLNEFDAAISYLNKCLTLDPDNYLVLCDLALLFTQKENFVENQIDRLLGVLKGKESLFAILFMFILLFATLTESIGLHFIIGSFFASMLLNKKLIGTKNIDLFHKTTSSMAMGFLAPIFFAGIGLEFKFSAIENYGLLVSIIAVSFLSKILGGYLGGRFAHMGHRQSITLAYGLNARGIMELVIANIAFREGFINVEIFSMLVIMGLVTTLSTPFLLKQSFQRLNP